MKAVIPGGSGHVGSSIRRHLEPLGWDVKVLSRHPKTAQEIEWDGKTLGPWVSAIEGADVVINLAGRSVNCRYNQANLDEMMSSRVDSARVIGQAIAQAKSPPRVWLQASTATIYAHRLDAPNDEKTGILGGDEPGAPYKWNASIAIAKAWEEELNKAQTPRTRKVALRSAMTMSADPGSVFDVLATLAKRGLGGTLGPGNQYVSWVHEDDYFAALEFLIAHEDINGPVNIASPNPLPNREFNRILRGSIGGAYNFPIPAPLLEIGAIFLQTETEIILKSRRVVPTRLLEAGFKFTFPEWESAAANLAERWRKSKGRK